MKKAAVTRANLFGHIDHLIISMMTGNKMNYTYHKKYCQQNVIIGFKSVLTI